MAKGPDDQSQWEHAPEPGETMGPPTPTPTPPKTDEAILAPETISHIPGAESSGGTTDPTTGPGADEFRGLDHLAPGQFLFGKYDVLEELGRGGMGSVWRVRHRELDVDRALKLIISDIAFNAESRSRFRREARVMARFSHPNAVRVADARIASDAAYIEMEFVRGRPLNKVIEVGRPMPLERAVRIVVQLCDALQAAHEHGIVHRDLKPANLMLVDVPDGAEDHLKVLDFGIAKVLGPERDDDPEAVRTEPGLFIGTPLYASPEQINPDHAEGDEIDPRSDIYSIGVILFELLTGSRPFAGRSALIDHLTKPPPAFAQINPEARVPAEVEAIVRRCLEKDPAKRPQSARELAEQLREAAGLLEAPPAMPRASRRVVIVGLVVLLALAGGLAWALWPPSPTFAIGVGSPPEIRAGEVKDLIVSVDRTRFSGPVRLRLDRLPLGLSAEATAVETIDRLASFRLRAALDAEPGTDRIVTILAEGGRIKRSIEVPIVVGPPDIAVPEGFEPVAGSLLVKVGALNCPREVVRRFDDGTEIVFLLIDGHRHPDLNPFYIMRDEVWNDLYRRFKPRPDPAQDIKSSGVILPGIPMEGVKPEEVARWPVVGVTAYQAYEFADWLVGGGSPPSSGDDSTFSGQLPTAAQWDKAAGFFDHPEKWLTTPLGSQGADDARGVAIELDHPRPVGTSARDVSPFGVRDMAGNVTEWTRDSQSRPGIMLPFEAGKHDMMIVRGHSFSDTEPFTPQHVEETMFRSWNVDKESPDLGFRTVIEIREIRP